MRAEGSEDTKGDTMTYRERRERRAERLREWADKRDAKAEAASSRVHQITDAIPLGQPILVGHHSERRARRDQDRIEAGMRQTVEHTRTAVDMRQRAANIDAAAGRAIYSDDSDAPERLRERIAELEAERGRIKAYNASCKKARDLSLLDERQQATLRQVAQVQSYALGKRGEFPGYALTNLSGNIRRNKERLAALGRPRPMRVIVLRYGGECDRCGAQLDQGATALHVERGVIRCQECNALARPAS